MIPSIGLYDSGLLHAILNLMIIKQKKTPQATEKLFSAAYEVPNSLRSRVRTMSQFLLPTERPGYNNGHVYGLGLLLLRTKTIGTNSDVTCSVKLRTEISYDNSSLLIMTGTY